MRMRRTGNDVHNVAMFFQNSRKGADYIFYSLVGRQQAECEKYRLARGTEKIFVIIRVRERKVGYSVRNQVDLAGRHSIHIVQQAGRMLAHYD